MLYKLAGLFMASLGAFAGAYEECPPILDPKPYTSWSRSYGQSKMAYIQVPFVNQFDGSDDSVNVYRLDLVGTNYERGFAQGAMLAKEIVEFADVAFSKYVIDAVMGIDISGYPEPLQEILHLLQIKGALHAPELAYKAMDWVYQHQLEFTPPELIEEMEAIGAGACYTLGESCNVTRMTNQIKAYNMFPELIKMACTSFGAWDTATESGSLLQLRALDLGSGPFANYTTLTVLRNEGERAFAMISFPGMVGAITGIAQNGIGITEKVWYNNGSPDPAGSYDGEADVFVLREILQHSTSRQEAETYMQNANRTWGIWVGVGDFTSQEADIVGYQQASATPYTPETMPTMTGQPYMENLVYVDKHGQPSDDTTLPTVLADYWGKLTLANAPTVTQFHGTGDHHIAFYDYAGTGTMIFSIGRINAEGDYGPEGGDDEMWMAFNRPYLQYSLDDLWNGL